MYIVKILFDRRRVRVRVQLRTGGSDCGPLEGFQDHIISRIKKAQYSCSQVNALHRIERC
eukprot:COSAG02_NODE_13335_length_1408_cov_1.307105_1_plen_59_part_10